MLKLVCTTFTEFPNFLSNRLLNMDQGYDTYFAERIAKTAKLMQVKVRQIGFSQASTVAVPNFLSTFKSACDKNAGLERAAMELFQFINRDPAASTTTARDHFRHLSNVLIKDSLSSCYEVFNYSLATLATQFII